MVDMLAVILHRYNGPLELSEVPLVLGIDMAGGGDIRHIGSWQG
jgi:hypothetical protein